MSEQAKKGLELLREPFPPHQISKLPKPFSKDSPKGKCAECGGYHGLPAVHLDYVGHAALTDRLLDADPAWYWEPLAYKDGLPQFDATGGLWIKLTVCGMTRLGYGHAASAGFKDIGSREKEVIGDALRNAAMRFGAALDLWHKGDLHGDDEPEEKLPKSGAKAMAVPHKRTTQEVFDSLDADAKDAARGYAIEVIAYVERGSPEGAVEYIDSLGLDTDMKLATYSQLDSKVRSALSKLTKGKTNVVTE